MRVYRIKSATGQLLESGESGQIIESFLRRHSGCKIHWGHHFRVMKRRTDPASLMHTCKSKGCRWNGEQLHTDAEG